MRRPKVPKLPRPVWLLSWTSFFTDTASEAVYPLMPLFLSRAIGASALSIGVIEGAAEAVNSLLRVAAGYYSDRLRRRAPFVLAGYAISSFVRPFVAVVTSWPQVLALRLADRVGKGVRGAPRDALLAAWSDPASRGFVFGLHRAMDHSGAVVGPLLASLFLWCYPDDYRTLFALTLVPGIAAVLMLLPVRAAERTLPDGAAASAPSSPSTSPGDARLPASYPRYLAVLFVFALGNSTDAFLLLRLGDAGIGASWIPLLWAALHVVKAVLSPIGGWLADRFDRRRVIVAGWLVYAAVYFAFARVTSAAGLVTAFLAYGIYFALTEGGEKALVADLAPPALRGRAFGWYHAVIGVGALAASLLFGALWRAWGAPAAFHTGAALALVAAVLLARLRLVARH